MKILKISSMKKEFNDNEKNSFEMKLINKTKVMTSVINNAPESQSVLTKIKIRYQRLCICETKYN